jgi:2-(1,2-epoxy-1,2-dihydrophenyl)acetyl-CoA isomerase
LSAKERPGHEGDCGHHGRSDEDVVGWPGPELPIRVESHHLIIVGIVSDNSNSADKNYKTIVVERSGGVVTVTFNRPKRKNAANGTMWIELLDVLTEIHFRSEDRVVVFTGAGGEFCSGADLVDMGDGSGRTHSHSYYSMREITSVIMALARLPQPTIAKVRGVAVGVGCNIALGCDLVVASDNARFSEIFSKRGMSLDGGGSWILPRRVGLHRAKELAFFADIIDAAEADRIGLVNRVVPDAELDAFVDGWVERLLGLPPIALAQSKRLLNNAMQVTLEEALDDEGVAQAVNFSTKDTAEAISAFVEKRAPHFKGR